MDIILDFDDWVEEGHGVYLDMLKMLRQRREGFKVTLFAIAGKCSRSHLNDVQDECPWIQFAMHGDHHLWLECASWDADRMNRYLDQYENWNIFKHMFRAPYWADNEAIIEVLAERGYIACVRHALPDPGNLKQYIVKEKNHHGHIQNIGSNGLVEAWPNWKALDGNFRFISELFP